MKSLRPYPNFSLIDDAGGLIVAAIVVFFALGAPGLFLIGTGPIATPIGIALLIIPCLLLATAVLLTTGALLKFVAAEAAASIREIRSERQRHLQYLQRQQQYKQEQQARQQQKQVIIEMERREHEKRSSSDPLQ